MAAVVTLTLPVVAPAATVTEAGTVSTVLVFVRVTAAPPVEAAFVSVTVQVLDAFGPKLAGHANEETSTGATRLIVAGAELLLYVAVTVAARLLLSVVVLALKLAVVAPAATVTEAGTVSAV